MQERHPRNSPAPHESQSSKLTESKSKSYQKVRPTGIRAQQSKHGTIKTETREKKSTGASFAHLFFFLRLCSFDEYVNLGPPRGKNIFAHLLSPLTSRIFKKENRMERKKWTVMRPRLQKRGNSRLAKCFRVPWLKFSTNVLIHERQIVRISSWNFYWHSASFTPIAKVLVHRVPRETKPLKNIISTRPLWSSRQILRI